MSLLELKEIMTAQERYRAEKPGTLPDDLYLRRWTSPALNTAPDIWIAGNVPLPDIQKLSENYATGSSDVSLQSRQDNYIYVRARNNASEPRRRRVAQLYAAELDLIMWPHSWKEIYTDTGSNISPFATVASQAVAVATETFVFPYVVPATSGYTLIAQINDLSNQLNPKPQQSTPLDMAAFNADPLWASTNTCLIPAQGYVVKMDTRLTTASTPKAGGTYLITLDVKGCVGTEVELKGSTADSKGKPIQFRSQVTDDGRFFGSSYYLVPSYNAYISLYIYTDDMKKVEQAELTFTSSYQVSGNDIQKAVEMGLIAGDISLDAFHSGYIEEAKPFMALRSLKLCAGGR